MIAYGNNTFVAIADGYDSPSSYYYSQKACTSSDGSTWTVHDAPTDGSGTSGYVEGMCFGDGKFVVVGDGRAVRSTNGINWNVAHMSGKPILYGSICK
jgi:hypothetical protein